MTIIFVKDYGREEYLDGAEMQFSVLDGEYPCGHTIAYVDTMEHALKIAQALGDEGIIQGPSR